MSEAELIDAVQDAPKRGPGRPPKPEKTSTMVTYVPRDGDPAEVDWNKLKFKANVPRPVTNPIMIEQAKGNLCFTVEGHDKKAQPASGEPKTPEAYKAYAVEWFKSAKSADDFQTRWDDEADMRERAGIGTDDVDWLESIARPRLAELKKLDQ